jgi:hypothetical protein
VSAMLLPYHEVSRLGRANPLEKGRCIRLKASGSSPRPFGQSAWNGTFDARTVSSD